MTANPWQSPQAAAADPWAVPTTQQKTDEFDLFTSDRAVNQSPQTAQIQNNNNLSEFILKIDLNLLIRHLTGGTLTKIEVFQKNFFFP